MSCDKLTLNVIEHVVNVNESPQTLRIVDCNDGTSTTLLLTSPTTQVVTVTAPGPQGAQGVPGLPPETASYAISSSYSVTASYLDGYVEPFPYTGSAHITGSLHVTGSMYLDGQFDLGNSFF